MAPQDVHILILGTRHILPHRAKDFAGVIKDLELWRLPRFPWWPH